MRFHPRVPRRLSWRSLLLATVAFVSKYLPVCVGLSL